jgi:hypothetical protein
VDFIMISKWSSLANFAFAPTFKWWHTLTSTSPNLWFN